MTLELAATTGGDVGGTLELLSVPLSAFEVGPALVTPYLGVDVRFSGHADAGAQVSVVAPFDATRPSPSTALPMPAHRRGRGCGPRSVCRTPPTPCRST